MEAECICNSIVLLWNQPFLASLPAQILSCNLKGQCPEILKLHGLKDNLLIQRFTSILLIHIQRRCSWELKYWWIFLSAIQKQQINEIYVDYFSLSSKFNDHAGNLETQPAAAAKNRQRSPFSCGECRRKVWPVNMYSTIEIKRWSFLTQN